MEDYCQSILFATNLVEYVLEADGKDWECPKKKIYKNIIDEYEFGEEIVPAVLELVGFASCMIYSCHKEIVDGGSLDNKFFRTLILGAFADFFPGGYTAAHFLSFCTVMAGLTILFAEYETYDAIPCIIDVTASVLMSFVLTGEFKMRGGMNELNNAARKVSKYLDSKKEDSKFDIFNLS